MGSKPRSVARETHQRLRRSCDLFACRAPPRNRSRIPLPLSPVLAPPDRERYQDRRWPNRSPGFPPATASSRLLRIQFCLHSLPRCFSRTLPHHPSWAGCCPGTTVLQCPPHSRAPARRRRRATESQPPALFVRTDGFSSSRCRDWRTTRWPTTIDQTLRHSLPRVISQARLNLSECHRDCALCIAVSRCTFPYIWFLLFCHLSLRLYCFVGLIIVVIKLSQRSRSSLHDKTAIQRAQSRWHSTMTVWPGHRGRSHRPNTTGPSMPHKMATQTLRAWNGAMGYLSPPTFTLLPSVRLPDWGDEGLPADLQQSTRHYVIVCPPHCPLPLDKMAYCSSSNICCLIAGPPLGPNQVAYRCIVELCTVVNRTRQFHRPLHGLLSAAIARNAAAQARWHQREVRLQGAGGKAVPASDPGHHPLRLAEPPRFHRRQVGPVAGALQSSELLRLTPTTRASWL